MSALGPQQQRVYDTLQPGVVMTAREIAVLLGELKRTVANALYNLKQRDLVARSGHVWARTNTALPLPKVGVARSAGVKVLGSSARMVQVHVSAGKVPPPHTTAVRSVFELGDRCRRT